MKRPIVYFLLCLYLLSFTEAKQMLKIPDLIEHYISHNLTNTGTTLFSFWKMHYVDEQIIDSDYEQDMSLPFKTHESGFPSSNWLAMPDGFHFEIALPDFFILKKRIFSGCPVFISNPLFSIFHPPILV
ncbi:MAG: hypothetical protein K0M56_01795 [Kaistella sp.]|nr:hypothetical protein [Kaistella sp.]